MLKILIAEDEQDISATYEAILARRGHEITIAPDGESCIDAYRSSFLQGFGGQRENNSNNDNQNLSPNSYFNNEERTPFDLVVLDYRMPKKDGLQVAKEVLDIHPRQRIIFASAFAKDSLRDSVKDLRTVVKVLQKPFSSRVLVETIENQDPYLGLKLLIKNVNSIRDIDNPSIEDVTRVIKALQILQKGTGF